MSSRYEQAKAITVERLSEIFGHETAHLEPWEQYAIAAAAALMLWESARDIMKYATELRHFPS